MKNSSKHAVEVLCDGGDKYGFGHIRRSYTLARVLEEKKYPVKFTVVSETGKNFMPDFGEPNLEPVIQIFDLPYEIEFWVEQAKKKNILSVALDYFGDACPDSTISIYEHRLPPPVGLRFVGLEYAIIRGEILQHIPAPVGDSIVVMIGGSDLNGMGEAVAMFLSRAGKSVNLVEGPAIAKVYSTNMPNVNVFCKPKDLEAMMSQSEWAVTNGGGSMMEMMSLGKAVHVVPQTNDELFLAQTILKEGALLGVGFDSMHVPSSEKILTVGQRARELVDGRGVERIVSLIENMKHESI